MKDFLDLVNDIWDFLKVRKKYWLAPLIITILLMGALIVFTQGSVVAPFIYSIFQLKRFKLVGSYHLSWLTFKLLNLIMID